MRSRISGTFSVTGASFSMWAREMTFTGGDVNQHSQETGQGRELREWFGREVLKLLPDLVSAARRLTRDADDAEDLVADAVALAWTHLDALQQRDSLRGWLFRILTNRFISQQRSRRAAPVADVEPREDEEGGFSIFDRVHQPFLLWWGRNPETEYLNRLLREDLERAVDALPDVYRVVVVLVDVEGFTYQEAADALEVPIGTVRSRLARARAQLQKSLWMHAPAQAAGKSTRR